MKSKLQNSGTPVSSQRRRMFARIGAGGLASVLFLSAAMASADWRTVNAADNVARQAGYWRAGALSKADAITVEPGLFAGGDMLDVAARSALFTSNPDLDLAEDLTRRALARSPARADAWARLADIDVRRHGRLTPQGLLAFKRSFAASPFGDRALQKWRLQFAAIHWNALDADARASALSQIDAIAYYRGHVDRFWMRDFVASLPPGQARVAMNLAISRYD